MSHARGYLFFPREVRMPKWKSYGFHQKITGDFSLAENTLFLKKTPQFVCPPPKHFGHCWFQIPEGDKKMKMLRGCNVNKDNKGFF